jgi:hypothetical protein
MTKSDIKQTLQAMRPEPSDKLQARMCHAPWQSSPTSQPTLQRGLWVATLATLVFAGLMLFTPLGTWAQEVISRFFNVSDSNTQRYTVERPVTTPMADALVWQAQAIQDAQAQADFTLAIPDVPAPYAFDGADVYNNGKTVMLTYRIMEGDALGRNLVLIQMPESEWEPREVGADAVIEAVTANGLPAEYTKGFWRVVNQTMGATTADGQQEVAVETVWDDDFGLHFLEWANGDMVYQLMWQETPRFNEVGRANDIGRTDAIGYLTLDDLVTIAESVR